MLRQVSSYPLVLSAEQWQYHFKRRITQMVASTRAPRHDPWFDEVEEAPVPWWTDLPEGQRGRFVVDLSHLDIGRTRQGGASRTVTAFDVQPGVYTLALDYPDVSFHGEQPVVELQGPNEEEARLIRRVRDTHSNTAVWEEFIVGANELLAGITIDNFSRAGRRQLAYHLILAHLVHDARPVGELTIDDDMMPDDLWDGFRTAIQLLRYEIANAADDLDRVNALRAEILHENPGVKHALARIERCGGEIERLRGLKDRRNKDNSRQ